MKLSEAFEAYCSDVIRENDLSLRTEGNYRDAYRSFEKTIGDLDITKLTHAHVRTYGERMKAEGKTAGTMRGYKSKLKNVLKYTNKKKITSFDLDDIKLNKLPKRNPEYITSEEVGKMLRCAGNARDELIISLMFSTGIRVSELANANRRDIRGNILMIQQGKGSKDGEVILNPRVLSRLMAYLEERNDKLQPLLMTRKKCRITPHTIQKVVKETALRAGITRPVSPRILRHSFATDLHSNGADIRYVQHFMRHEHISTTQIYTHIIDKKAMDVFNRCQTAV